MSDECESLATNLLVHHFVWFICIQKEIVITQIGFPTHDQSQIFPLKESISILKNSKQPDHCSYYW